MLDIPAFTAAGGAASLVLSEIEPQGVAYVMAWRYTPETLPQLLSDAAAFCRDAGAMTVFGAAGGQELPHPHAFDVIQLTAARAALPEPEFPVALTPLSAQNAPDFLRAYNTCFHGLDGAVTYTKRDIARILANGRGFLAYQNGALAGIGEVRGDTLHTVAVLPGHRGLGTPLALALLQQTEGATLHVQTVSTNAAALRLYEKLGFRECSRTPRWYRLL